MRTISINIVRLLLNKLADWEFEIFGQLRVNRFRRAELRFLKVNSGADIRFGREIMIRNRGNFRIGRRCCLGSFARIWNYELIEIGDDFIAAGGLTINSAGHDVLTLESRAQQIKIGDRVWCGVNVTILAGVEIGDDVVIGAGSLVNKSIPSNTIAAGVPARFIRSLERSQEMREQIPANIAR